LEPRKIGDVGHTPQRLPAFGAKFLLDLGTTVCIAIEESNCPTRLTQPPGNCPSDPSGSSCDQRDACRIAFHTGFS
jgi:hypothetical protein